MRFSHGRAMSAATWLATALLVFLAFVVVPSSAFAVLLADERFLTSASPAGPEYSIGAIAGQDPTGIGFSGAWFTSTGASHNVNATTLNYSNAAFPAETGGTLLSVNNSRVHRLLAASNPFEATDSGTVYCRSCFRRGPTLATARLKCTMAAIPIAPTAHCKSA